MNHRGMSWLQPFLVVFFAIILLFAVFMITLEKGKLPTMRAQVSEDLRDQRGYAMLNNLLRSPTKEGSFADTIILAGLDASYASVVSGLPELNNTFIILTVTYADNSEFSVKNIKEDMIENATTVTTVLPGAGGNVQVSLQLATDDECRENEEVCTLQPYVLLPKKTILEKATEYLNQGSIQ